MAVESAAVDEQPRRRVFESRKYEISCLLELIALTTVAICQPVLSIFGDDVASLLPLNLSKLDVVVFLLLLVLVPATVLWLIEVLIGFVVPQARDVTHCVILGVIVASIAIDVVKYRTAFGVGVLLAIGVVAGAAGVVILLRYKLVREWVRVMAILPILSIALFLGGTPARALVINSQPKAAVVTVSKPARVVMIVMDEFSEESLLDGHGSIDAGLFPNFSALSRTATWYRNTTTVAPNTTRAVPSILTGDMPKKTRIPSASDFPHSIFTLLAGSYAMNVHESVTRMCPDAICHQKYGNASSGLSGIISTAATEWKAFSSPARHETSVDIESTDDALDNGMNMLKGITPSDRPQLDFVHVLVPHAPWHYLSGGRDTGYRAAQGENSNWHSESAATVARQRHLMQLQAGDWLVGQVTARLKAIGEYDNSLIVVTADHGIAFSNAQPIRGYSKKNFDQILWVPLLIKAPAQTRGVRDDAPVLNIDIVPTIADILGIKMPWKVDGQSVLGPRRAEGPRPIDPWSWSTVSPQKGQKLVYFDGARGFAKVLAAPAWNASAPTDARIYGAGSFGPLVDRHLDQQWVDDSATVTGSLGTPAAYSKVDVKANRVPWVRVPGRVNTTEPAQNVAIVVNGVIAGVSPTTGTPGNVAFNAFAMPDAFRPGQNDVEVYVVSGTTGSPRLVPVKLRN